MDSHYEINFFFLNQTLLTSSNVKSHHTEWPYYYPIKVTLPKIITTAKSWPRKKKSIKYPIKKNSLNGLSDYYYFFS